MKHKTMFHCTIMRGGTSKGIFLMDEDLPSDPELKERLILSIFGSPDIRQIDGLGGADSLTSKLALISISREPGQDIRYTFGAVGIDKPFVDYSANCGNISSAVGPYAIDKGLVQAIEPFTTVRILNTNTGKMIYSKVPVKKRRVVSAGDYAIDGVPGTGAKIELSFMDPGGAVTGKLLPTGNRIDEIALDSGDRFRVTIVDAGNPTAFVDAAELGLTGKELPDFFAREAGLTMKLEAIRRKVGEVGGIAVTPSIPKISFVAPSQDYKTTEGTEIKKGEVDILARVMAMGKLHKAFAVTAAIPAAAASVIPGSVVHKITGERSSQTMGRTLLIGHPSGQVDVRVDANEEQGHISVMSCTVGRTARKIMEGKVYIPDGVFVK